MSLVTKYSDGIDKCPICAIIKPNGTDWEPDMIIGTRIFELSNGKYQNLSELAQVMGISVSQIYRVKEGKRNINQKFIIGAIRAFPGYTFDDLFYLRSENANRRSRTLLGPGNRIKAKAFRKKKTGDKTVGGGRGIRSTLYIN